MKNISAWAIRHPITPIVLFVVLFFLGAVAFIRLPINLNPDISFPIVNVDGGAFAYYAVTTTSFTPTELSWFIDNTVTKRLLAVPGVAQVSRSGGVDREIRVELDPGRLQALGMTAVEVNEQLRALNLDAAGGRAEVGGGEQSIRVLGGAKSAAALADAQIIERGGKFVRLGEIAEVRDGVAEVRNLARLDGRPATAFSV